MSEHSDNRHVVVDTIKTYLGWCSVCDEPAPEVRDSYEEAARDSLECPCGGAQ